MTRLLVQLSDTHIREPGRPAYGRVDTSALLAQAVAAVVALPQPASAVVVTGDLTDFGRAAEYAQLRWLLAPLACPLYLLPGNHDDRDGLRSAFPELAHLRDSAGPSTLRRRPGGAAPGGGRQHGRRRAAWRARPGQPDLARCNLGHGASDAGDRRHASSAIRDPDRPHGRDRPASMVLLAWPR